MTKYPIYDIWRPPESPWSSWVKPVLFSFLGEDDHSASDPVDPWEIPTVQDAALIADMPGAEGVFLGVALAASGYRPIPVYNACPWGIADPYILTWAALKKAERVNIASLVDLVPTMSALCGTAPQLAGARLAPAAPPVFLVDSDRRGWDSPSAKFDNRSYVRSGDFPSAVAFEKHGISKVILIQAEGKIQVDLLGVLRSWQQDGMAIFRQTPWKTWDPQPMRVPELSKARRFWEWLRHRLYYSRDAAGAFGGVSSGSGSGG